MHTTTSGILIHATVTAPWAHVIVGANGCPGYGTYHLVTR